MSQRGLRRDLYLTTVLNRVQIIENERSVQIDLSDYSIQYVIGVIGVDEKGFNRYIKHRYKQDQILTLKYDDLINVDHTVIIDYILK